MNSTEGIELELDVLNENNNTYVSVTDLYDVNIFTDNDMDVFQSREEQEKNYYTDIQDKVFVTGSDKQDNTLHTTLFMEETSISKRQDLTGEDTYMSIGYVFIGIIAFFVFVLAIIQYNTYRAVRRKRDADTNNIYWGTGKH